MKLTKLFKPRSVALIGASRNPNKIGHTILVNILTGGYHGSVYPVNPFAKTIRKLRTYANVRDLPKGVDLAIIAIPAVGVVEQVIACGKKGIRAIIVISAGFEEVGGEGIERDAKLRAACKRYHIELLGPNCLGLINTASNFNASFSVQNPDPGGISFISQSGALMVALIDWSRQVNMGIRTMVSLGNQSGIQEIDALEYLAHDPGTKVIGLYLEEINDAYKLSRTIARISRLKPIVVLKSGSSPAGQRAVSSHTGSLADEPRVVSYLFERSGALQVDDIEDLFNVLKIFALSRSPISQDIVVVSNAGGPGVITVDLIAPTHLRLASLTNTAKNKLKARLPDGVSVGNPIDLMGDADLKRFQKALVYLVKHSPVRTFFIIVTPQSVTPVNPLARYLVRLQVSTTKKIIACFIGGDSVEKARKILAKGNVLNFKFPYDAIRALEIRSRYETLSRIPIHKPTALALSKKEIFQLPYAYVQRLLIREKIPLIRGRILRSENEIVTLRQFPVAMKILSRDVIHKDDAGGVVLGIRNRQEARRAYRNLTKRFAINNREGILSQPMVLEGRDWFIGVKRDALLGVIVLVGAGGTSVEALGDVAMSSTPISVDSGIKLIRTVHAARKLSERQIKELARIVSKVASLPVKYPRIHELDLNPVKITNKGDVVIDARIIGSK